MNSLERLLLFAALLLTACGTTRNVAETSYHVTRAGAVGSYQVARAVAVGSYRVASAPVRYATGKRKPVMVGTTEATPTDVTNPGQPVPTREVTSTSQRRPQSETAHTTRRKTTESSTTASSSRASAPSADFPTAKSVPGKPGYVLSPFDSSGRYVDVSGYAPGTKVKDPWTDKIFIVP